MVFPVFEAHFKPIHPYSQYWGLLRGNPPQFDGPQARRPQPALLASGGAQALSEVAEEWLGIKAMESRIKMVILYIYIHIKPSILWG